MYQVYYVVTGEIKRKNKLASFVEFKNAKRFVIQHVWKEKLIILKEKR